MDFIIGLPPAHGSSDIFMVADRLSKETHFEVLPARFIASKVDELFVSMVVCHHGYPHSIMSDQDAIFGSSFCRKLFELSGTNLSMSNAYHPHMNG